MPECLTAVFRIPTPAQRSTQRHVL